MEMRYDPEYLASMSAYKAPTPEPFKDVWELRAFTDMILSNYFFSGEIPDDVLETKMTFISHDGQEVSMSRFATKEMVEAAEPQAAVVYAHGGAMVAASVEIFASHTKRYVKQTGLPFFAIDFRPAPEFPGGQGAEDVYFGVKHLSEHAAEWNVDPARIVLLGDSGGGGVAAGAALIARDRGLSPPLRKQVLIYPMLDDRTDVKEGTALYKLLTWKNNDNRIAWGAVLGEKAGKADAEVSLYASPGRATPEDLRGLPPTYVDVGSLDLFRDESVDYVAKLAKADVEVEFHIWPGLPHGFESASTISWVKKAGDARCEAMKRV